MDDNLLFVMCANEHTSSRLVDFSILCYDSKNVIYMYVNIVIKIMHSFPSHLTLDPTLPENTI